MDEHTTEKLLSELRERTLPLTLIYLGIAGFAFGILDFGNVGLGFPPLVYLVPFAFAAVSWSLREKSYSCAAWVMNAGLLMVIVLVWHWLPESDAQSALFLPVIAAAVTLGPLPSIVLAALSNALLVFGAFGIGSPPASLQPLITEMVVLWGIVGLICVWQLPLKTVVAWAWQGYEEARRRLDEARDRQAELKQSQGKLHRRAGLGTYPRKSGHNSGVAAGQRVPNWFSVGPVSSVQAVQELLTRL